MVELHWVENTNFEHFGRPGLVMLGYDQDHDNRLVGQQPRFPEFRFDRIARDATHDCLMNELPSRIAVFKDGVTFAHLFSSVTNETPATSEIIKETIRTLQHEELVDIRDEFGVTKRRSGVQHAKDVIKPPAQKLLFIPGQRE